MNLRYRLALLLFLFSSFFLLNSYLASAQGIASRYPGDVGIRFDSDVLLADDFESYATGLTGTALDNAFTSGPAHWSKVAGEGLCSITDSGAFSGNKALRAMLRANNPGEQQVTIEKAFTPYTTETYLGRTIGTVVRNTDPSFRTVHIRWYQKWQSDYLVSAANHNGGQLVGGLSGTGGSPPLDGSGWYTILMQNNFQGAPDTFDLAHSPFRTHMYVYWPGRTTDHAFPGGVWKGQTPKSGCTSEYPTCGGPITMWGDSRWPHFNPPYEPVQRPDFRPAKDQWYCYELAVTVNTLDSNGVPNHDGEIKAWIDGEVKFHFTDLFMMGAHNGQPYNIDRARLDLQSNANSNTVDAVKFYDNVVVAKSYIGPMSSAGPTPTPTATPSPSPSPTATPTPTPTPEPTATPTPTPSPTPDPTATPTPEPTPTPTPEPSPSPSLTPSPTPSPTPEPSPSPTPTPDPSPSPTPTPTPSATPTPTPANLAPIAKAGSDKTIRMPNAVWLYGSASDDGLPIPPAKCAFKWSKVSGPGSVTWSSQNSLTTSAKFSIRGTYVLKLAVSDGQYSASDTVTVAVLRRLATSPSHAPALPR